MEEGYYLPSTDQLASVTHTAKRMGLARIIGLKSLIIDF